MLYPQDVPSRHVLNSNTPKPSHWALVVVVAQRVVELQRWEGDKKIASEPGPKGLLLQIETTPYRLVLYFKKRILEWHPKDGAVLERPYEKGEKVKEIFRALPGEPQFRGQADWCAVIIDGDVKACLPSELYAQAQAKWNALSAAQRTKLLGKPVLEAFGGHLKGALKILRYVAAAAIIVIPPLWFYFT